MYGQRRVGDYAHCAGCGVPIPRGPLNLCDKCREATPYRKKQYGRKIA